MIIWVWVNTHYGTFWGRWTFIYKPFRCWQGVQGIDPHLLVDNLEWIPNLGSVNSHCRLVTFWCFWHSELFTLRDLARNALRCFCVSWSFFLEKSPTELFNSLHVFFAHRCLLNTVQVPIFGDITVTWVNPLPFLNGFNSDGCFAWLSPQFRW